MIARRGRVPACPLIPRAPLGGARPTCPAMTLVFACEFENLPPPSALRQSDGRFGLALAVALASMTNQRDCTIGEAFRAAAREHPSSEALVSVHQAVRYTYAELEHEVECVALALLSLGIRKGDRVGIWSQNCAEWTVLQFATARVGAILVNVNPAYRAEEMHYAMHHSG